MTQLLFTAFSNRHDALELAREASARLADEGIDSELFLLDSDEVATLDASTLVVSLGGDGTFLKAARLAHDAGARLVAVNLGRLGFLLDIPSTEIVENVKGALNDDRVSERLALKISVPGTDLDEFALNEVVVERATGGRMVKVRTFVADEEYLTYSSDGVMVATPTGSTGYNFSAGGPVVDATLPLMILTPVAPHFTIDRSIVVPAHKVIRLEMEENHAVLVADGRIIMKLEPGQQVEVRENPSPVRVVATRSFGLAVRLRRGLREGHA